jgi:hypothetical protein
MPEVYRRWYILLNMDGAHTRWTVFTLKGIRHCIHHVRLINIDALQRQQGVGRNMITTGHDFKTKLSPDCCRNPNKGRKDPTRL